MRMLLASSGLEPHGDAFVRLVGGSGRVGVVLNACDGYVFTRDEVLAHEVAPLVASGLVFEELDLRTYFAGGSLAERLDGLDAVWVVGGNTFTLARAMQASGFARLAARSLADDALAYGGYSAGACVVGPDLTGIEEMDDPGETPPDYPAGARSEPIACISQCIVPHWNSEVWGSRARKAAARLRANGSSFQVLADGQALLIGENGQRLLS